MEEKKLVEIEVSIHGPDAPKIAREKAEEHARRGDAHAQKRWLRKAQLAEEQLLKNASERERKLAVHPNEIDLFAGISGTQIENKFVELMPGVHLENVFAHVMAPYIVAFAPAERGKPHPGPWKAASGGFGFDVTLQLFLAKDCRPTNFDRLNTLWWLTSLMRLLHSTGIRVPLISDKSFSTAGNEGVQPIFWPMEMSGPVFAFDGPKPLGLVSTETLTWLRTNFQSAARLMENPGFNLAFRALSNSQRASSNSESMLLIWSAIEALFRPSRQNITHKLSMAIATLLEDSASDRDKLYHKVKQLYSVRGQITHAAEPPDEMSVLNSFHLARRCFVHAMEKLELPDVGQLEIRWKTRT